MIITSKNNTVIAETKKLKQSKYRKKENLFLVEGEKNLYDSLKNGEIVKLFVKEGLKAPNNIDCPTYTVTETVLKELSDTVTPQGLIGVFKIPQFDLLKSSDRILALNGVSDPGNVGTILRTALAMGYTTILCDEKTADVYSPKVARSAMSAIFSLNILKTPSLKEKLAYYKNEGYEVFAGSLSNKSEKIENIIFPKKNIIVMGNEGNGVTDEILEICDKTYIIPMSKDIESLNVAVAAGITMFIARNFDGFLK